MSDTNSLTQYITDAAVMSAVVHHNDTLRRIEAERDSWRVDADDDEDYELLESLEKKRLERYLIELLRRLKADNTSGPVPTE